MPLFGFSIISDHYIGVLKKGDDCDRMDAARYLGGIKEARAVVGLIEALNDENPYVRSWAAWALAEIGDQSAIDPLIGAFERVQTKSKHDKEGTESKCLTDFYLALEKLTGLQFGMDLRKWKEYSAKKNIGI